MLLKGTAIEQHFDVALLTVNLTESVDKTL